MCVRKRHLIFMVVGGGGRLFEKSSKDQALQKIQDRSQINKKNWTRSGEAVKER